MDAERRVAIYWDLENVVLSEFAACHGKGTWSKRASLQPAELEQLLAAAHVDVSAVVDFAATLGVTTINRAYGDWSSPQLRRYDQDLLRHSVDLVQLFPLAHAKNGADIRMAIDAVDDLAAHRHVTDVLLVTGDSDFVSLAQRCRRYGRSVTAIGVRGSTSPHLVSACDLFRYYDMLIDKRTPAATQASSSTLMRLPGVDDATRALVAAALSQLAAMSTDGWVPRVRIKPVLLRMHPAFDESESKARTFTEFMELLSDLCESRAGVKDIEYRLRSSGVRRPRGSVA